MTANPGVLIGWEQVELILVPRMEVIFIRAFIRNVGNIWVLETDPRGRPAGFFSLMTVYMGVRWCGAIRLERSLGLSTSLPASTFHSRCIKPVSLSGYGFIDVGLFVFNFRIVHP